MAYSDDLGWTWADAGALNPILDVTLPLAAPLNAGTYHPAASRAGLIYSQYVTGDASPFQLMMSGTNY